MKAKTIVGSLLAAVLAATASIAAQPVDDLEKGFVQPPDSAKPQTWWHWMDGNITKEGITADLEAMARVGIGGAQIFNASAAIPRGPIAFNSPEWLDLVKFAAQEANRLGLELCIHNCGGWSSSGGPWNTPEHGMQVVVTSEQRVHGPVTFDAVLPQPAKNLDSYHDIAVLAYRTAVSDVPRFQDSAPKVTSSAVQADLSQLMDGKDNTTVGFPLPDPNTPQFIQFEFAQPYSARQLTLKLGTGHDYQGRLEISDDGQTFRTVRTIASSQTTEKQTFTFDATSARFYRLLFTKITPLNKGMAVDEVELKPELGIDNLSGKAFFIRTKEQPASKLEYTPNDVVERSHMVDLTSRLGADGKLTWDVPEGDWTILRVGYTPNGRKNHPAPESATGLECDKLSKEAVQAHWDGMMSKVIKELGSLAGKTLNNVLIDSYEVGSQNWTPKFREEFQKRRGYDLVPFLPVLNGRFVDSPEITERFLWDFRRTIADLFAENYSGQFAELAHRNGLKYSVEPYGNCPTDDLQYGSYADIPMSEFWPGGGTPGNAKLAASVGHVYGRKFVGAEAFTAAPEQGKWLKDPYSLKAQGDLVWCAGVNRFIFHRYAHQPWTQPARFPGMTMGPWGTHFERTTTWWEQSRAWLKYIARSQYLLQQGSFVADVCCFAGDNAPNGGLSNGSLPQGYDYDTCSADALKLMSVKDGRLVLPNGMSYRLLALPPNDTMTLPTLRKIKELADAGALIVGQKPTRAPGLTDYPQSDEELLKLAADTKIITDKSPAKLLAALNVPLDFEVAAARDGSKSTGKMAYIHRAANGTDLYFVSNQRERNVEIEGIFRISGKVPELWHADTGRIEDAPLWREENGRTIVPLKLDPSGSVFVVFRKPAGADHIVSAQYTASTQADQPAAPELTIIKAEYGVFNAPDAKRLDITARVAAQIKNGELAVKVGNELAGGDPAPMTPKELRVEYRRLGVQKTVQLPENRLLELPEDGPISPTLPVYQLLVNAAGKPDFEAWQPGTIEMKTATGKTLKAEVPEVPQPIELGSDWKLSFPPNLGAPAEVSLPKLISWTDHTESGVKYFSGTATYSKEVEIPKKRLGNGHSLWLNLGQVKNIAEVSVNGKPLGILWKPPFCVDITAAAKPGVNKLEIKITNLWPNRLIGDDQLPPDCEWMPNLSLKQWPQWLLEGKPSPTGRLTFTTWHHWKKDDTLLPSGLLGPVTISSAVKTPVK